jgi:osmotically-inducible protein OsmY
MPADSGHQKLTKGAKMLFGRMMAQLRKRVAAAVARRRKGARAYSKGPWEGGLPASVTGDGRATVTEAQIGGEGCDRAIEAAAAARLREWPELAEQPITCAFREGTLTLRGRVTTYSRKQAAQSVVRRVGGVLSVDNRIDVIPVPISTPPTDDPRPDGKDCCRAS